MTIEAKGTITAGALPAPSNTQNQLVIAILFVSKSLTSSILQGASEVAIGIPVGAVLWLPSISGPHYGNFSPTQFSIGGASTGFDVTYFLP